MSRALWGIGLLLLTLTMLGLAVVFLLRAWVGRTYEGQIYSSGASRRLALGSASAAADLPQMPTAIVFGAGYWPSGRLSDALADRMDTAIDLYRMGKVNKLLLTGDNRVADYNEPAAMAAYARARAVPPDDLVLDYAGRRTYDSCYRAGAIFGVKQAILVTQGFHLPRALYTCDRLGLEVVGMEADRHRYVYGLWYQLREVAALTRAWLDLNLLKPLPVLGDPIPVDWDSRTS